MRAPATPGPWSLAGPPYDSVPWNHVYGPADRDGVGRHIMHRDRSDEEKIANARLIAAAPDLMSACETALTDIDREAMPETARILREALAKAEGEALDACKWCTRGGWYESFSGGVAHEVPCDHCNPHGLPARAQVPA